MSASSFTPKMSTYPGGFTNTIERFIFRKLPYTIITNGGPIGISGSCGATLRVRSVTLTNGDGLTIVNANFLIRGLSNN